MNKIAEWFKNLEAEFIILFTCLVILFILILVVINAIRKIKKTITFDGFKLTEDLIQVNENYSTRIRITNISFATGVIKEIGFMEKKIKFPRLNNQITIEERDHYSIDLELKDLRGMMTLKKKIKMFVYIIDGLNQTKKRKLKLSNKKINNIIKLENKNLKLQEKRKRFETGNYNLLERIKLVLALIFSPLVKLGRLIKKKTNEGLHKRELKKQVKLSKKELEESQKNEPKETLENDKLDQKNHLTETKVIDEKVLIEEIETDENEENNIEDEPSDL